MVVGLINANPVVYEKKERRVRDAPVIVDEYAGELIDQQEIFDILHCYLILKKIYPYEKVAICAYETWNCPEC
jgi:hypothetical protein